MSGKTKVMLSTEGTYPFHQGGVSTWCDILVNHLDGYEFVIYSIIMNPYVTQKFTLPPNTTLIKVPLWGTEEPSEHLAIPFSEVFLSKKRTTNEIIETEFLPLFLELIDEFIAKKKDPVRLGKVLLKMHFFFEKYEYKVAFKSDLIWENFKNKIIEKSREPGSGLEEPSIFSMIQSLGWVYRFLNVVNTRVPMVDVTHSAAAAFCGIPCVLAKLKNGTPFILTEHGVYLREQYFSLSQRGYVSYMNTYLIRMIHSVVDLNYYYADQVSPVCSYNTRWEKEFGVKESRINVIYNGVDKSVFYPQPAKNHSKTPIVVTVARVDPLKDIKTLIKSAALVIKSAPDVSFHVYGAISVNAYYEECEQLVKSLGLEKSFIFKGHVKDVPAAYNSGDVVVLTSISEAFPYSVVEAMLSEKAIVATDVGGIKEALGETGILAEPGNVEEIAAGIIKLLSDKDLRQSLATEARERALNLFTLDRVLKNYGMSYNRLATRVQVSKDTVLSVTALQLELDKAYALVEANAYHRAIEYFKRALQYPMTKEALIPIFKMLVHLLETVGANREMNLYKDKLSAIEEILDERVG